jgi:hypothetical protein
MEPRVYQQHDHVCHCMDQVVCTVHISCWCECVIRANTITTVLVLFSILIPPYSMAINENESILELLLRFNKAQTLRVQQLARLQTYVLLLDTLSA